MPCMCSKRPAGGHEARRPGECNQADETACLPKERMKDCETCGNEIAATAGICRYCGSVQRATPPRRPRVKVRTVNMESGRPSVVEGLERLQREIALARQTGVRVLRVIHGWGSSGTGGRLRTACRAYLYRELKARHLKAVVPGDDYSRASPDGRDLLSRYDDLRSGERSDTQNAGITFIEL